MLKLERTSPLHSAILAASILLWGAACGGGGNGPTDPGGQRLSLVTAAVSVDGVVYNGGTYHHGQDQGDSTRFEARLTSNGGPAPGERVWVDYGRGMMRGRFGLYDDGTHGDPVPGDGVYCLEDSDGRYGFHHAGAPHGGYHYEFWGEHHGGSHSNHLNVTIQVAD